jgi:hypothetical protein
MNYEMAVLAALVQIDNPTRPKITNETGISAQRINTAINYLKELLDIGIQWRGAKKTGYYEIESWGVFETGKSIRRKAYSLNLTTYRTNKVFEYDSILYKKHYANEIKLHNYRHSLKLEGFDTKGLSERSKLSASERAQRRDELKKKYTKPPLTSYQ